MTMRAPYKSQGVVGGKTKNASCSELGDGNASCSELGDENESCSELGGLQLPGVRCPIWAGAMAPGGGRVDLD